MIRSNQKKEGDRRGARSGPRRGLDNQFVDGHAETGTAPVFLSVLVFTISFSRSGARDKEDFISVS
jgi:hypothetical protein